MLVHCARGAQERKGPMPTYGVIDLGSNSIRMVIYDVKDDRKRAYTSKDFKSIINDKVMAGLAAFVEDGVFTDAGIDRAVGVLKSHMKRARYFNCKRLDVFATAVLRNASNCHTALAKIEQRTGMPVKLLTAHDEAHLGFVGATCSAPIERGTLVDIGGGSTELSRIVGNRDFDDRSLPQGSLSSFSRYVRAIVPAPYEMDVIACALRVHLKSLPDLNIYRTEKLYGIGGSVRAAAKVIAQVKGLDARPRIITAADVADVLAFARENPNAFAHAALKASAERVHTVVPGCIILDTLFAQLGADTCEIRKGGVREGYLIERILLQQGGNPHEN